MHPGIFAATHPDKPAYILSESGTVVTYKELNERSNQLAHLFRTLGLNPGDHIAILMENHPQFLTLAWAAQRSGLYYTAISHRLQVDEVAYIVNDCSASLLVTSQQQLPVAQAVAAQIPHCPHRYVSGEPCPPYLSLEQAMAIQPTSPIADECEGSDMLYSSGTTGKPKGIKPPLELPPLGTPGTLYNLVSALYMTPGEEMRYLSPAPLYHAAPLRYNMTFQRTGATCVIMEKFDAERYLHLVEQYAITHSQLVPTMFVRMLKLPPAVRDRYDVSSLKSVVHAAAPCPVPVKQQMIDWWGPIIHEYYAGTEGMGFTTINSEEWSRHPGSVGRAILGEVKIVDDDLVELPCGEIGTVYFANGAPFEYHNDPHKTAAATHPQGWTTLGDVGYLDAEGYLYLTDRKAYTIISGGVNIYPQEAEDVLVTHPKVTDVAVFGVPNEEFGEEVKAVVQPSDMALAGAELEQELLDFCRSKLSPIKCPRSIDFEAELPRHPTGKLYKRLLKDRYWK
ncbi:AMP-binding protein [Ketobacter sp.]|uniref:AMP-binding protein n=1 Tax=Ketobacter sp. TaxID=2083498 RepID=UPI000F229AF5|nr:AMP-binding protein [Ketobacter sp.]RLT92988.1 MAG: acyl-CoA synthetase [Ketobacter sp.]